MRKIPSVCPLRRAVPCFAGEIFNDISTGVKMKQQHNRDGQQQQKKFQLPISDHRTAAMLFFIGLSEMSGS